MIDVTTVEEYMRDANPIPNLDALDADELAFAVAAVETRRATVMQAPTQHPRQSTTVTPPPQRRRSVWAFAAAFILILVVVGGAALLFRSDDTQVTNEPETPTTMAVPSTVVDQQAPPTTATGIPSEPVPVESLVWSRVPHDEAVFSPSDMQDMKSVTTGGPGLVAVGETYGDAAVWTSVDAITWSLVSNDEPPFGGPGYQSMQSVTAGGPGLVAAGFGWDEPDMAGSTAIVWTSVDGIAWSRVPYQDAFGSPGYGGNGTAMRSVTVGGPGLVAVGTDGQVAAVWTSTEGVTWMRTPHNPEAFGTGKVPDAATEMEGVAAGGPGLVAVGTVSEGIEEQSSAAVWTSVDGVTWSRVAHDEVVLGGVGGRGLSSVTLGGPGLVAVGGEEPNVEAMGGGRAAVWTSPDGVTWSRVPDDMAIFGGGEGDETGMDAVVATGSGLVAVGGRMAWTSPDGITWTRVPDADAIFGIGEMEDVIVGGPGLIAVGEYDDNATVWRAVPED